MERILNYFSEKEEKEYKNIYRGFTASGDKFIFNKLLGLGFSEVQEFGNGVRWILINEELKAVYTYCEGDLTMEIFKTDEDYQDNYNHMKNFYEKY